jgi:hypothetical protein
VAARRLVIVMLVLLGVSTLAAALAPMEQDGPDEDTTTTTTTTDPGVEPSGRLLHRRIPARRQRGRRIRVEVGDQLALAVASRHTDQVEIPDLGELEDVFPDTPARFDLLLSEPGRHAVRLVTADRTVGRVEVAPRDEGPGDEGPEQIQAQGQ